MVAWRSEAVRIEKRFIVERPPALAWPVLTDLPRMAACLPYAEVTEDRGQGAYAGRVGVQLGPIALQLEGVVRVVEMDRACGVVRLDARGADKRGRGAAAADITCTLRPHPRGTEALVETDLKLTGAIAQYGRGAGMISAVADEVLAQFSERLEAEMAGEGAARRPGGLGPMLRVLAAALRQLLGLANRTPANG
jgi:hypothetical protein